MYKRKIRSFVRFVIAGLVFLFSSCAVAKPTEIPVESFESLSYQPIPTNMPEISAIEGNAEIKLPPSAHEIHAYTTGMRDIFIMVRFSMNSSELPEFIKSTLCDQPLARSTTLQESAGNNFDWWVPEQAQYAEECSGEKEHSHQQILIDMSDKDVYIIYVSTGTN
ncbi:MAG: hypothetical protein ABI904_14010 [Chloroflexota bacterium]